MALPLNSDLDKAIEDFQEMINLDRKVATVISQVMARSPNAVLIAWEEAGSVKATTIPFSTCLVKGMVDTLFDMVFKDDPDDAEDDQDLET
jgi:hypothetical protein